MINIQTGISEDEQLSNYANAALHGGPEGLAVSIDMCVTFPEHIKTESDIKSYLRDLVQPISSNNVDFNIYIGESSE